jgi:FtsH-binding integral membrane protein
MATVATGQSDTLASSTMRARTRANRRFENLFFSGMVLLILATVFVGFAKTYFLAGVFRAHLPNVVIHLHGAAFTAWMLLVITQTSLVSADRVDIHRKLGIAGFCLACLMVVLGTLAATNMLARGEPPFADPKTFYAVTLLDMVLFATMVFFAFRTRRDSSTHKRLILLATIGLLDAAFCRWPLAMLSANVPMTFLFLYIFILLLAAYDLWSIGRIHRATLWGGLFVIFMHEISLVIGRTAAWHDFAAWAQRLGRW